MKLILTIAIRNLLRQKRRNILLGAAISFGTMILIVSSSFSHGITNTLFERIIVYVSGHVGVTPTEGGNVMHPIFHDGDRLVSTIKATVPERISLDESIGGMARAIGNGRSDNIMLVGMDVNAETSKEQLDKAMENFKMVEGDFMDLLDTTLENPSILSVEKAKYLNVKKGDIIRIRFPNIHGQNQAARLTVAAIFKPANLFMSVPVFVDLRNMKRLMGYSPHEVGQFFIGIKDPVKNAVKVADRLHAALKPGKAVIEGEISSAKAHTRAAVLSFKCDSASLADVRKTFVLLSGAPDTAFSRTGSVVSENLAHLLSIKVHDTIYIKYAAKYDGDSASFRVVVKGVRPDSLIDPSVILVNERDFFKAFYYPYAAAVDSSIIKLLPTEKSRISEFISNEWDLLARARSTEEVQKQYKEAARIKSKSTGISITSMYESASAIIKLEYALNLITFIMVAVLFFIILIGVVNTLRMTIRERTREIGTIRAIGMQKHDVRNSFIAEVSFLAFFASITGTILAFIVIKLLGLIVIDSGDNPMGMLLVSGHLQFVPTLLSVAGFNLLIVIIAAITAFFPAKRAANLNAVEALRHYE